MTTPTVTLDIDERGLGKMPPIAYKAWSLPHQNSYALRIRIAPRQSPGLVTLTLNGGANLVHSETPLNCGITVRFDDSAGTRAADTDFNFPSNSVTFRASCAHNVLVNRGETYEVVATVEPYGQDAAANLEGLFGQITAAFIPSH